jgi:hypothetical protein
MVQKLAMQTVVIISFAKFTSLELEFKPGIFFEDRNAPNKTHMITHMSFQLNKSIIFFFYTNNIHPYLFGFSDLPRFLEWYLSPLLPYCEQHAIAFDLIVA